MTNAEFWISMQMVFGYASEKPAKILEYYETVKDFIDDKSGWKNLRFLNEKNFKGLKALNLKKAIEIIDYCDRHSIKILTLDDEKYPILLKRIKNPPAVIYIKGELPDFDNEVGISMVGTRNSTLNGNIVASTLAYRIAEAGGIVVSGGANGIDTKCSQGALFANMPSVIVRPCGINNNYLYELRDIREKVALKGAVISEYPPLLPVPKGAFFARNRIIAALSLGVAVIEAPLKSGTMITVSHALEMGKDVYVVPGDISAQNYGGSNKLLQDGATPIYSASDVLNEYIFTYPHKLNLEKARIPINEDNIYLKLQKKYSKPVDEVIIDKKGKNTKNKNDKIQGLIKRIIKPDKIDKENKVPEKFILKPLNFQADECVEKVYKSFKDYPMNTDELTRESGLKVSDVLYALTELEINDVINPLPGGRYEIK